MWLLGYPPFTAAVAGGVTRSLQANRVNRCQSHLLDRHIPAVGMFMGHIYALTFFSTLKNYKKPFLAHRQYKNMEQGRSNPVTPVFQPLS